ncbi:MAG: PepSY domain-containing protein [Xanthobacteraceae bacterium]|nr:PepSY domain-containing protein [Xanthobacteraceae bacterium]
MVLLIAAVQLAAADPRRCLSGEERRTAVRSHKLVPLAKAISRVRAHYPGDLVAVRLCQEGKHLLYVLTVLPRSGKVVTASVDAATGVLVGGS